MTLFFVAFLLTILLVRGFVHFAPSKTVTGYVRHKTLLYIHHLYIGIILLGVTVPALLLQIDTPIVIIGSAVGLALCIDELSAWILFVEYPSKRESLYTALITVLFVLYVVLIQV